MAIAIAINGLTLKTKRFIARSKTMITISYGREPITAENRKVMIQSLPFT
jgi:hypothetical protein